MVFNIGITRNEEVKARYSSKAVVNHWSSINNETHESFRSIADKYGCSDIVLNKVPDRPFSRNVFKAHSDGSVAKERHRQTLQAELNGIAEVFSVVSPDGAGMTAMASAQPFQRIPLEVLTFLLVVSPSPRSHEQVCQAVNLATLLPDKHNYVFLSKADHDEHPAYPRKIAKMLATLRWIDSTNIFSRAAAHREIQPGSIAPTRAKIRETLLDLKTELGTQSDELLGFDPAHWLVGDMSAAEIWGEDKFEAYVRVPLRFEGTNLTDRLGGNGIVVKTDAVPVPYVQVFMTREVSSEFVSRVKVAKLRWLWQNAYDVDHWCKLVRRERGRDVDPRRAVKEFVTERLHIRDPDVLAVFEGEDINE